MDRIREVGRVALTITVAATLLTGVAGLAAPVAGSPLGTQLANGQETGHAAIDARVQQTGERNRLVIESTDGERSFYEVRVTGSIAFGEDANPVDAEFTDSIGDGNTTASGSVAGGSDDYTFTGELAAVEIDGPATVSVNGEQVDPDDLEATTTETATTTATGTTTADTGTTATGTPSPTETATATSTDTPTPTATETATETATPTTTETTSSTTTTAETPSATQPTPTARTTAEASTTATTTRVPATTGTTGQPPGLNQAENGLFLTIGAVLLLGVIVIGTFALVVRR